MELWAGRPDFNGCYFINALGEYGGADCPEAEIARTYKKHFLAELERLCRTCGAIDWQGLARTIYMLIDGATMARLTLQQAGSYADAKSAAKLILANFLPDPE